MKHQKNQENVPERGRLKIEVIRKEDNKEEPKKNSARKITYAILLIAAFIALTSGAPATIIEEYETQETVIEKIPKTIIEFYNETRFEEKLIPYMRNVCEGEAVKRELYKYDYSMDIDSLMIDGKRKIVCAANVTNKESQAGNFTFYADILRTDGIGGNHEDKTAEIPANGSAMFMWKYETDPDKNAICTLKPQVIPTIVRCEVKPDGISEVKRIAIAVEKQRNKTILEEVPRTTTVTKTRELDGYKNRLFGWRQPFYLGY